AESDSERELAPPQWQMPAMESTPPSTAMADTGDGRAYSSLFLV
ncbi:hypothetical protein A2U01_0079999, partial [Trifolium medium]|nr:hypothetical protein [Trifolium medium]